LSLRATALCFIRFGLVFLTAAVLGFACLVYLPSLLSIDLCWLTCATLSAYITLLFWPDLLLRSLTPERKWPWLTDSIVQGSQGGFQKLERRFRQHPFVYRHLGLSCLPRSALVSDSEFAFRLIFQKTSSSGGGPLAFRLHKYTAALQICKL
jgi:hypothetical protein